MRSPPRPSTPNRVVSAWGEIFGVGARVAPVWPRVRRLGLILLGSARLGPDCRGPGMARLGLAMPGLARLGSSWLSLRPSGSDWHGPEASPRIGEIFPPPRGPSSASGIQPYIYIYIYIYVYTHIYIYIYIYMAGCRWHLTGHAEGEIFRLFGGWPQGRANPSRKASS